MSKSARIVYMGTPGFAVMPLQRLVENGYNVVGVVTAPDKASGRGLQLNCSEVKKYAESAGLKILQPVSLKDEIFIEELKKLNIDIMVVVAFRMLPKIVWSMPKIATFNLHGSLLPEYRGAAPINWAIINGEKKSGVTPFVLDEEIDTGSIVYREECPIDENDNFGTLHDKLQIIGTDLVIKTVDTLSKGEYSLTLQSSLEAQMGDIKTAPKLNKENTKIDWTKSSESVSNLIRGLSPYPCAHSILSGPKGEIPIKIFSASFCRTQHQHKPGTILSDNKSFLKVACGEGFCNLLEVQLSGKKRMMVRDLLLGFREAEKHSMI